jgi:MFS family permease
MTATNMPGTRPLRKNRAYQGVFWSQTCTDFAEQFLIVAITWAALHRFGGQKLGFVMAAWAVPRGLLLLFGGVVADRWDRRSLAMSVGAMLTGLSVVAAFITRNGNLEAWIMVALCLGALDAVRLPLAASVLPMVVDKNQILETNRWANLREWGAMAGGPALGGVIVATFGTGRTLLIITGMYAGSCLLMVLAPALPVAGRNADTSVLGSMGSGLKFVVQHPRLRVLLPAFCGANLFVLGLTAVVIPVYAKDVLHAGPQGLGTLSASFGVGLVCGTVLSTKLPLSWQESQARLFVLFTVSDVLLGCVGISPDLMVACLLYGLSGLAAGPAATYYRSLLQTLPPEDHLGRVNSIARAASFGLEPVSLTAMGGFTARLSASVVLVVGGAAAGLSDIAGLVLSRRTDVDSESRLPPKTQVLPW